MLKKINERELEIREAMMKEERLKQELENKTEVIDSEIEKKGEEIDQLTKEKECLAVDAGNKISEPK